MPRRREAPAKCRFGGNLCDQPAGHGKFQLWCPEHAALLAEIAGRKTPKAPIVKPKAPVPVEPRCSRPSCDTRAWKPDETPPLCYHHYVQAHDDRPRCLVAGCRAVATRQPSGRVSATCAGHRRRDVDQNVLAAWDDKHPTHRGRKRKRLDSGCNTEDPTQADNQMLDQTSHIGHHG